MNCYPFADALEVLKSNTTTGVFGSQYKFFGDTVIFLFGKATFFFTPFFEQAFSRLRALSLQFAAQTGVPFADAVDLLAGIIVSIAVGGNVIHAKVNAKKLVNIFRVGRFDIAGGKQIKLPVDIDEITFSALASQKLPLTFAADKRDVLAPANCPNRDIGTLYIPLQDSAIIRDCAKWLEDALAFFVEFVSVYHFANTAHNHLRRKVKLISNIIVRQVVYGYAAEFSAIPGHLRDIVTGRVSSLKRGFECFRLLCCSEKFDFRGKLHVPNYTTIFNVLKGGMPHSSPD